MSSSEDVLRAAAEHATDLVRESPGQVSLGSRLGQAIRERFPTALVGYSLTILLDEHAEQLFVVGRSGTDLIWGMERSDDAPEIEVDDLLGGISERGEIAKLRILGDPEKVCLSEVRLQNYRSLKDVTFHPSNLTMLVGANGSGKSNLLDGLFRAVQLCQRKPSVVFTGAHDIHRITTRGGDGPLSIALQSENAWGFEFRADPDSPSAFTGVSAGDPQQSLSLPSLSLSPLSKAFGPATYLRLSAPKLASPSFSEEEEPFLRFDGLYLPSVLDYLAGANRARLLEIIDKVREVIPQVEDIRTIRRAIEVSHREILRIDGQEVPRTVTSRKMGHALEVKMRGSGWIPSDQLSEGTLLMIGLHTKLLHGRTPKLILLDDIDRGLHPRAQEALIEQLKEMTSPTCRIVGTAHSPFLLSQLKAEAVRIVQMDPKGHTHIANMTDHPEWAKLSEIMNPAEFWLHTGDDWICPR